ncbi:hypothetical protein AT261_01330 [Bacillus cereus]|uniref:binary toxin-like calcium binding domain-containing protein n=1 Tax=unclassified Bacillus (in: firmicutes) TaxID=185979 RepID=UPI00077A0CDF|nr:hypothetical protein AT261_01330 [Bacillus cereus]
MVSKGKQSNIVNPKVDSIAVEGESITIGRLMGYYYNDENFTKEALIDSSTYGHFRLASEHYEELLTEEEQVFKSIRWIGYIRPDQTEDYTFSTSNDKNSVIWVDGEIVNNLANHMVKDQFYRIRIDYRPENVKETEFHLYWSHPDTKETIQVPVENLYLPNLSVASLEKDEHRCNAIPNLFDPNQSKDIQKDQDGDNITDSMEKNGYTVKGGLAVAWKDEYKDKGYTRYVSNPHKLSTAGDIYSDFQKASGLLDGALLRKGIRNPLVAAWPVVGVRMEKLILSESKQMSNSEDHTMTHDHTYSNTEGVTINAGFADGGFTGGTSVNYSHTDSVSNGTSDTTGDTVSWDTAHAAYVDLNIRYFNTGTTTCFNIAPTTNFVLVDDTLATIKAQTNNMCDQLQAGGYYPTLDSHPIALTTWDQFNGNPISINKGQLVSIQAGNAVQLETPQVSGVFATINDAGIIVPSDVNFSAYKGSIESHTASVIISTGTYAAESRIATKDADDPEDLTPESTLGEALHFAFGSLVQNKDGKPIADDDNEMYFVDDTDKVWPLWEEAVGLFYDDKTQKAIQDQFDAGITSIYNVTLRQGMNITIKIADRYHDGTTYGNDSISWNGADLVSHGLSTRGTVTGIVEKPLDAYTSYILKLNMKNQAKISIGDQSIDVNISEEDAWGWVQIPFKVLGEPEDFNTITIQALDGCRTHFADISIIKLDLEYEPISKQILEAHSFHDWIMGPPIAGTKTYLGLHFSISDPRVLNAFTKYHFSYVNTQQEWDCGVKPRHNLDNDGLLKWNLADYTDMSLDAGFTYIIKAVLDTGEEIEVLNKVLPA